MDSGVSILNFSTFKKVASNPDEAFEQEIGDCKTQETLLFIPFHCVLCQDRLDTRGQARPF